MGGGGSKPIEPVIIEDEPPAGSEETSIVYPSRPGLPRLDGISRTLANECDRCNLQVVSGISSSSVKVSREYGTVSYKQCTRYFADLKSVREKKMSFQDFKNNLQNGVYYRGQDNGYCEQVELSSDDAMKMDKIEDYDEGKLRSVRIQQATSAGFSSSTKARFTPSIPFQLRFSAGGGPPVDIPVRNMTLYHPCPIRIESVQPDAVLCLNDPAFGNPSHVVLIPLVGKNTPSASAGFLQKILTEVISVSQPDPSSGQYIGKDIPVGQNWKLSQVFETVVAENGKDFDVKTGFYVWKGMPGLDRVKDVNTSVFPPQIRFKWVDSGKPTPQYILLDTPVPCNPADIAILTSRMPVTPPSEAIHAILYNNNPFQKGIVHKQGPPDNCFATEAREGFTDVQGVYSLTGTSSQEEEACDAWTLWAQATSGKGFTQQQINSVIFGLMVFIAMAVGTYVAFSAVLRMYDVEYSVLARNIGKLTAVFARNLQQKAQALKSGLGNLTNPKAALMSGLGPLGNPKAALSSGLGDLGQLANPKAALSSGLSDIKADLGPLADPKAALSSGLNDIKTDLGPLANPKAALGDLSALADAKPKFALPKLSKK